MDQAFIAGVLQTAAGKNRDDSQEYSRRKSHKMKLEAAAKAGAYFKEAKRKIKILEEEEFEKLRLLVSQDEHTVNLTKDMFIHIKAVARNSMKYAKDTL